MTGAVEVGTWQEPLFDASRVAALHREVGTLLAACNYAVDQLGPHALDSEQPELARALAVLRDALSQVTS